MFLVDACDRDRFQESKNELDALLTDEQLSNCPVLILGNKIDRAGAASEDELRQMFGLYGQVREKERKLPFFSRRFLTAVQFPDDRKGQGPPHRAPRPAARALHVLRVEEAGIRRGLQVDRSVPRLNLVRRLLDSFENAEEATGVSPSISGRPVDRFHTHIMI